MTTEYLFPTETLSGSESGGGDAGRLAALDGLGGAGSLQLGLDVLCLADLDPQLQLVGGRALLAQDLAHRFETPAGGLFYDDSYGYDLRALLNAALDEATVPAIAAAVEAQCLLDERVEAVRADVTLYRAESRLRVAIAVECAAGPFSFSLLVDELSLVAADFFAQAA